jgi:glucose-1-phosphate thymidylyltransferase
MILHFYIFGRRIRLKGIIIAGGNGTRLNPLTKVVSKALLPVYNKPIIYYPLSVLIQAEITEILIITSPLDKQRFIELLGDGSQLGISLSYEIEPSPKGIGQAFLIGEKFINGEHVALILADNLFYGEDLNSLLKEAIERKKAATIFGYYVKDPNRFGVVSFNKEGKVKSIEEKPSNPKSNFAVTGLYLFDHRVVDIAKSIKPSSRGEIEITDINKRYLQLDDLHVELLGKDFTWMDMGTHHSLFEAAHFIEEMENQKNKKIGCIEEIVFRKGLITKEQLTKLTIPLLKSEYGTYLKRIVDLKTDI